MHPMNRNYSSRSAPGALLIIVLVAVGWVHRTTAVANVALQSAFSCRYIGDDDGGGDVMNDSDNGVRPYASTPYPANLPSGDCLSETVYALYKPRGVLSAARDSDPNRRTLTDVMIKAGVPTLPGHVGRLDAPTSGLILVTSHGLLMRAVLNFANVVAAQNNTAALMPKRYELLLAGRHEVDSPLLESLAKPLFMDRGGREIHSDGAQVWHISTFKNDTLAVESQFIDRDDEDADAERAQLRIERRRPARSRATDEVIKPFVPFQGWLTVVELEIFQGRNRQIRRLCKRADLKLLHLRRLSVGPVTLDQLCPGEVRVLCRDEKSLLYEACLPNLLESQRRYHADKNS